VRSIPTRRDGGRSPFTLGFFVWQREEKRRAFARLAFDPYLAAVALDDLLDDGQANE